MATQAQIEANRRNSMKSTGPRTPAGKDRSKFNALDHGCRAKVLVLPDEDPEQHQKHADGWFHSLRPRNPTEEFLVDRMANLAWQSKRIDRADSARLARRVRSGEVDAIAAEVAEVIELGERLYAGADSLQAPCSGSPSGTKTVGDGRGRHHVDQNVETDNPRSLVHRLERTVTGCQWLLEQWGELRMILERGAPWLAPDQRRAVRLLGRRPTDALYSDEVAQVYIAACVLSNGESELFEAMLDELSVQDAAIYAGYLQHRSHAHLVPKDNAAAREVLLEIIDRTVANLEDRSEVLRELAELNAPNRAELLLWDDTPEGERLRRYRLSCSGTCLRMLELLRKVRQTGEELGSATIASLQRSYRSVGTAAVDQPVPTAPIVETPPDPPAAEPGPTIEANFEPRNLPNEANFHGHKYTSNGEQIPRPSKSERRRARHRADRGRSGQVAFHQELDRQVTSRTTPLLDVSAIL